jgi:hypothetical protein
MWAARPHLGSIFEKLLHRKTFWLPTAEKVAANSIWRQLLLICFALILFN